MTEQQIASLFRFKGFRATPQRVAVYKFLLENPIHPDAEEIYRVVLDKNPCFSKTTVYNSVQALEEHGLIVRVCIDKDRVRYDANTDLHGHFLCTKCGRVVDFPVTQVECELPSGFTASEKSVYFSGICPDCK